MEKTHFVVLVVSALAWMTTVDAGRFIETKYHCPKRDYLIQPCKCLKESDVGVTIFCENTNLASLSISLANLAVEKIPIEELRVEKSHFSILFGTIFRNIEAHKIVISDTPLEDIEEHVFWGVNETLKELEIHNSLLTTFPKAVKILGKLTSLKLDNHSISTLDVSSLANSPASVRLERLYISNGNVSDVPVEFVQSLRKLKILDFHGNNVTSLKKNQFKNLRDLEALDLSHNRIAKLDSSHIADLTKLGFCNVSHNAIGEITRGTFARNSVLRVLNMSHNKIKRLDANSFRGMRFLRRLYLSDNLITDIARGTFTSITRIGTIDLARNQIKKIDYQMFAQLNYVEIIDVAENRITEVLKQSFKDLYLTHINMSHNAITKFEAGSFENCVNMTTLDLSHNQINAFSKYAFDELSYATNFLLSYNAFTNLSSVPLSNMTGLKVLNVSHNEIVEIPKNSFPKLYELHTIDLSHNRLSIIANAVLQTLFSLRNLNLSHNSLETIKSPTFGTLPTLLDMDLSRNRLTDIARGAFTKLISLRTINVEHNQLDKIFTIPLSLNVLMLRNNSINEIPARTWPSMNALLELDLSENKLGNNLQGDSFSGLLTVRILNLNSNGISVVPRDSLSVLSTLQYLYLENNNLTEMGHGTFGKLPVVFELNLKNNQIRNISSKAFDGLLQLLKLDLSANNIRTIPTDAFTGLVSLRKMDLSFNQLKKLDNRTHGVLDDCLSLESINLSHNKFSFITSKTFPASPWVPYRLREIDLSYNEMPVLTYDLAFGTSKVKILNISHNVINEIRRNVLSRLEQVEVLDLSHNELKDLKSEEFNFTLPDNLTHLYFGNNQLTQFPSEAFANLSTVREISLENNAIREFDLNLLKSVRKGLALNIEGNPVRCDCRVRPLRHHMSTLLELPPHLTNIMCASPKIFSGRWLHELTDDNLNCVNGSTADDIDLQIQSDLIFREILFSRGNLTMRWTSNVINKDVAGFYVVVRNSDSKILLEHHLSYEYRHDQIIGSDICDGSNCRNLELCVLSKNSHGIINGWFDAQCVYLPNELPKIMRKYSPNNSQVYVIHSVVKRIKAKTFLTPEDLASHQVTTRATRFGVGATAFVVFFYSLLW